MLAPALKEFGEDKAIDQLIRSTATMVPFTLQAVARMRPAREPGAAAHLIHGSTEGRFTLLTVPGNHRETYPEKRLKG